MNISHCLIVVTICTKCNVSFSVYENMFHPSFYHFIVVFFNINVNILMLTVVQ